MRLSSTVIWCTMDFSGNPGRQHFRKFVFLLSISSSFLAADIEIQTMDNWGMNELLYLEKHSDVQSNGKTLLYLR